ncbi:MAG: ATP-binding protein, partial [Anaerolineae bacterium]|nr:ATP-binding protein [Anaerolineae bacterium]
MCIRDRDLILLELSLPDADELHLIRSLKSDPVLPFIPLIATKAHPTREEVTAILDAGADEFITKPIDNVELLTRVRAMLRLKAVTDELADLNATLEQKVLERTRELEKAHAALRHNEKLAALGRLAASVAHEINNPLSAILLHIYLLRQNLPQEESVQEGLDAIQQQIELIARLTEQLRDFARPPRRERRKMAINEVIENTLSLVGKELQKHNIHVERKLDPNVPPVMIAPDQIGEVLMNLIVNARDAMPEGGTLRICTHAGCDGVYVCVADTGVGIPPEILPRVFEPFFTTKGEHGTGLGLAISHSIMHEHGGDITVESQVGQGTKFTLYFPLAGNGRHQQPVP